MDLNKLQQEELNKYRDKHGDIAPPWEAFPELPRYCIGWRMGAGEHWLDLWSTFLRELPKETSKRIAFLRRHPPAPINWTSAVCSVLYPDEKIAGGIAEIHARTKEHAGKLLKDRFIASDIAYQIWLSQFERRAYIPWKNNFAPQEEAFLGPREFWFWSRMNSEARKQTAWKSPSLPANWNECAQALNTGKVHSLDLKQGFLSLAKMLCAGEVKAPWQLCLKLQVPSEDFNKDSAYIDAFCWWATCAFDDQQQLCNYLNATQIPDEWTNWIKEQLPNFSDSPLGNV